MKLCKFGTGCKVRVGAMAQAAKFFELSWVDAAKWGHPIIGDIELTEGPPAMVKHTA